MALLFRSTALALLALPAALLACSPAKGVDEIDASTVDAQSAPDAAPDAAPLGACEQDSIALDDLWPCVIEAQCDWGIRCGQILVSFEECVEEFSREVNSSLFRTTDSIEAERTTFDGAAAATCLDTFYDATCDGEPGEDCGEIFIGTIADGNTCLIREECSGIDARCERPACNNQCCEGSCQDTAPIGGGCSIRRCEDDAECVANICQTGDVDSICDQDSHCDSENHCGAASKCVEDLPLDAACKTNGQCSYPATCLGEGVNPGYCALIDVPGTPCDGFCRGGLHCQTPQGNTIGVCVEKSEEDGACQQNSHCVSGLYCQPPDNICKPEPTLDESCEANDCADGLFCTAELPGSVNPIGVCAAPQVPDSACSSDQHCESDICGEGSQLCEDYQSCY